MIFAFPESNILFFAGFFPEWATMARRNTRTRFDPAEPRQRGTSSR